jgi:biotin synthase
MKVRLSHCLEDVEVEDIITIKTGGCPETATSAASPGSDEAPSHAAGLDGTMLPPRGADP